MSAENLPYFKFISEIIRGGLWAKLSPAARALYPVLLSFSDRYFKPVYPGTKVLLELTGFKHKTSLQKARKELVDQGLLTFSTGNGRKNSYYQFCFSFIKPTPGGLENLPLGEATYGLRGRDSLPSEVGETVPLNNQINISIDNNLVNKKNNLEKQKDEKEKINFFNRRFGLDTVSSAVSECRLGGIPINISNLEKILYQNIKKENLTWNKIKRELSKQISPNSLDIIYRSFIKQNGNFFIFSDELPEHLKMVLKQVCKDIIFEPLTKEKSII